MQFSWEALPDNIRTRLLQAGVGTGLVFESAHEVFQAVGNAATEHRMELFSLGCDMVSSVWEQAPLESGIAATLWSLHEQKPFLPGDVAGFVKFCSKQSPPDDATAQHFSPATSANMLAYEKKLMQGAAEGHAASFYIISRAVEHAFREHRVDWLRQLLHKAKALPRPLRQGLLADTDFADEQWEAAAEGYSQAYAALPLLTWQNRKAQCLYRLQQSKAALDLWHKSWQQRPWQVNTLLRLSDIVMRRDKAGDFPPGQGAVLLYSWNKSQDMDATLQSLAASELGQGQDVRIMVLDNGSTDQTPVVLQKWAAHFAGRMHVETLPVNIGAPAARNWLLALPQVQKADWAAFLDDDVAVPSDWLRHLWGALQAYPQSGVACGHAVDFDAPMHQQWTDMHVVPLDLPPDTEETDLHERFAFTSPHEQAFDFGDFSFMRPCVTAIGCCHMFTRQAMNAGGYFDIRFSPSQSDDVDHDLRRCLDGNFPIYNGHLRILHKRSTGYHKGRNQRAWASAVGNWFKLQNSYTRAEVAKLHALDAQHMWDDVRHRLDILQGGHI